MEFTLYTRRVQVKTLWDEVGRCCFGGRRLLGQCRQLEGGIWVNAKPLSLIEAPHLHSEVLVQYQTISLLQHMIELRI